MCADEVDVDRSDRLKDYIQEHFNHQPTLHAGEVTELTFSREVPEEIKPSQVSTSNVTYQSEKGKTGL